MKLVCEEEKKVKPISFDRSSDCYSSGIPTITMVQRTPSTKWYPYSERAAKTAGTVDAMLRKILKR